MRPAGRILLLAALPALLLCAPAFSKTFFNTTDASVRSDSLIREQNILLPRRIDSLVRDQERAESEAEAAARAASDSARGAAPGSETVPGPEPGPGPETAAGADSSSGAPSGPGAEPGAAAENEPPAAAPDRAGVLRLRGDLAGLGADIDALAALEARGARPELLEAPGWGAWAAALWSFGWSAEAIRDAAARAGLLDASSEPGFRGGKRRWMGRDPLRPELGGDGVWATFSLGVSARADSAGCDDERFERAMVRLRAMLGSAAWDRRAWQGRVRILAARLDDPSGEAALNGLRVSEGDNIYRKGRELALIEAVAAAVGSPCRGPLRLTDGSGFADYAAIPRDEGISRKRNEGAPALPERLVPDRRRRQGPDEAAGKSVPLDLSELEGALRDHFLSLLPGFAASATPDELDRAVERARATGCFANLRAKASLAPGEAAAVVSAKEAVPVDFGAGPYLFWPAGALVWGRVGISAPTQLVVDAHADGWWGDWHRGALLAASFRSSSLSGFAFGVEAARYDADHGDWDDSEWAVVEEERTTLRLWAVHGREFPVRLRVLFDRMDLLTATAAEARDLLETYEFAARVLGPDRADELFPSLSPATARLAERRELDGMAVDVSWGSGSRAGDSWNVGVGLNSYGGNASFVFEAPLVVRLNGSARREARHPLGRVGVEAAGGVDLSADALSDGRTRLPPALDFGFSFRDPAVDLALSQPMGLGLESPLRLADDMARGFGRLSGDVVFGNARAELLLGAGMAYRCLPRKADRPDELQKALLAQLSVHVGPIDLRWGWERRWRIFENASGDLGPNGPSVSDDRLLFEALSRPF